MEKCPILTKKALFTKKGHSKFHHPLFRSFFKGFTIKQIFSDIPGEWVELESCMHLLSRPGPENCYTKSDEKVTQNQVVNSRKKCVFHDGSHDLDDCQFYNEIPVKERRKTDYAVAAMKKFQLSIQQELAKTEKPARCAKRNTIQVYMDLPLKGKANPIMLALMPTIQLLKVIL